MQPAQDDYFQTQSWGLCHKNTHIHTHKHTDVHTHLSASLFPSYNFRKIKSHRKNLRRVSYENWDKFIAKTKSELSQSAGMLFHFLSKEG